MEKKLFDLSGKVALVTGGGSGMGRAICGALAEFGANVVCVGRSEESIKETIELLKPFGHRSLAIKADAFEHEEIKNMVDKTLETFGTIDVVFAHAAVRDRAHMRLHEVSVEDWDNVASTNPRGIFLLMKYVLPIMIKKKRGSIITTSAQIGLWPLPPVGDLHLSTPYITSKTAIIMIAKLVAKQYGEDGIRSNVICPGYHRAGAYLASPESMANMEQFVLDVTPLKRIGMANDIKGLAVYLASDASSFVTGQIFVEDGGFMA